MRQRHCEQSEAIQKYQGWIASSRMLLAMTVLVMSAASMTACGNKGKLKTPAEISKEQAKKEKEAAKKEKRKKEDPRKTEPNQQETTEFPRLQE